MFDFNHEKCASIKINKIPDDVLKRLIDRQNDNSSPFKYRLEHKNNWEVIGVAILVGLFFILPGIVVMIDKKMEFGYKKLFIFCYFGSGFGLVKIFSRIFGTSILVR